MFPLARIIALGTVRKVNINLVPYLLVLGAVPVLPPSDTIPQFYMSLHLVQISFSSKGVGSGDTPSTRRASAKSERKGGGLRESADLA